MKTVRTTVVLDEVVLKKTKQLAKDSSSTIKDIIEIALQEYLNKPQKKQSPSFKLKLVKVKGQDSVGLNLVDDRDAITDFMDNPRDRR